MANRRLGLILSGVTGRIGVNQHLGRAVAALRETPLTLANGDRLHLDPVLVGRDVAKLEQVAKRFAIERWTTDLDAALSERRDTVFFDSAATSARYDNVRRALAAGKHVLCDKPLATTCAQALELARTAQAAGLKNGVVMANVWLPGLRKLKTLVDGGFFGRVLRIRGEHGYWVFEGDVRPGQRPSWNYRKEDGGGIVLDMMCHWHYMLEPLFGRIGRVTCAARTFAPQRRDESGAPYAATADDSAAVICELESGALAQIDLSWCTRVRRDDLMVMQVDGSGGTAVTGIFDCLTQHRTQTPSLVWNAEDRPSVDYRAAWLPVPDLPPLGNAFKVHWELFLRHVCDDTAFPWDFAMASRGIELVEACYRSSSAYTWETLAAD
jgi:predicted dehydrogenase